MALIFCDGFEQYADQADMDRSRWNRAGAGGSLATFQTGRFSGGKCVQLANTSSVLALSPPVHAAEYFIGFAIRWVGTSMTNQDVCGFRSSNVENVQLQVTSGGELEIRQAASLLEATSGLGLILDTWYYIEVHVVIDNSVGEYEVRVDENVELGPATSQDTQGTGVTAPIVDMLFFFDQSTSDPQYDDLYLCDATGLVNNDFLGDIQVETVLPIGDGTRNDMTPLSGLTNWEMVDDGDTPDDDATYVSGSVVGDDELYDFADLGASGFAIDAVHAVAVTNVFRKAEAGARTVKTLARSNVTEVEGADTPGVPVTYLHEQSVYETDPDGGGVWDEAAVNAAEFGVTIEA